MARRLRAEPTLAEKRLWPRLRALKVHFRNQSPFGPYVVDFVCHRAKLVVEVDGGVHQRTDVALKDLEREVWLKAQGYRVVRFTNDEVLEQTDDVIARLTTELAR